jgi:hypothetical protein
MVSAGRVIGAIAISSIAVLCLYMYQYTTVSMFEIEIAKCRDNTTCEISAKLSGWGFVAFVFSIIFLIATVFSISSIIMMCVNATSDVSKPPVASPVASPVANKVAPESVEVAARDTNVQLEAMI